MLSIEHVDVFFKDFQALNFHRSISIRKGEKIGLIGSNGAGKSTLIKAILGLVPYQGKIVCAIPQNEIAIHMQQNNYNEAVPVRTVMEAILGHSLKHDKAVNALIDLFDFRPHLKKKFKQLSGGQKQRLTLILVMAQNSPLTIFDEVTSGLDYETRQTLIDSIRSYYQNHEASIIMVSHYYEELEFLVDKILYIEEGQFVAFGTKEELFNKYCGHSVYILNRSDVCETLLASYHQLKSPEHIVALSCRDAEEERSLTDFLIKHNINYKRSTNDIEIMSLNAYEVFKKGGRYEEV